MVSPTTTARFYRFCYDDEGQGAIGRLHRPEPQGECLRHGCRRRRNSRFREKAREAHDRYKVDPSWLTLAIFIELVAP